MTAHVNFIPPQRRRARRVRRRVRAWGAACAALAAVLAGSVGLLAAQGHRGDAGVTAELARVRAQLEQETSALAALDAAIARDQRELARIRAMGTHPDWSVLLRTLAAERGEHVVLERVELRRNEGRSAARAGAGAAPAPAGAQGGDGAFVVRLVGQARTQEHATRFTRRLEELRVFDGVRIIESRLVSVRGREFAAFQIECAIGPVARREARAGSDEPGGAP